MSFPSQTIVSPSSSSSSSSYVVDTLKPLATAITCLISMAFLNLALKCFDHLAWPILALGYPMCASVRAIETDSIKEMRDLISYWILLSLLYLFEYAFMWLLQWFQFWPYMKLMIIFWLIIPDFRRSSYVYSNLIRSYISMKPQTAICRLSNSRKIFVKKVNFLLQAEKYIRENGTEALEKLFASKEEKYIKESGTEALEKLIVSKNTTDKPDAETKNAIRDTSNKEMQQDIPYIPIPAPSENASSTMLETKGVAGKEKLGEEFPQSSTHKEVQKEWTCTAYEAQKAKTQPVPQKLRISLPKEEWKPKNITNQLSYKIKIGEIIVNTGLKGDVVMDHNKDIPSMPSLAPTQIASSTIVEMKGIAGKGRAGEEFPRSSTHKEVQKEWTCALCQVTVLREEDLNSHLQGRKHRAADEAIKAKTQSVPQKLRNFLHKEEWKQKTISNQLSYNAKNGESIVNIDQKGNVVMDHKVRELQKNLYEPVRMNYSKLRCEACNVCCSTEFDLACHLNGRKHLANIVGVVEF
ncbi:uncharacterized protein LOC130710789 isoform X2 [Lotus japonicus]|uniref:uncharacterized protein LOC130710789 isoform X2 n=1 Tax=Lotus japonicus TaxID=34305 RepID=UPI00258FC20E|nr:uncharacterized protein LOC130710789 isoform X2 [Lotus japonicus]